MTKTSKKIIIFISDLIVPGGGERICVEEASYLKNKGIETKILTFGLDKKALFNHNDLDIEIINKKGIAKIIELRKKIREFKPDLIIASSYWDCSYLYLATFFTKFKYVAHIHATMFWQRDPRVYSHIYRNVFDEIRNSVIGHKEFIPKNPNFSLINWIKLNVKALIDYLAVRKSKKIFTHTKRMGWEIKKLYSKDAIIICGGISKKLLDYKSINKPMNFNKPMILNVNRLDKRKRIDILLNAFAKIKEDACLFIGGTGEEKENLENLAKELGISDRVFFLGFIPENVLWDWYSACDVFAHPNWTDFVIAPYEALALQKKVVWSTEMCPEGYIKNNEHVFATEPTVDGIKEAIEKALKTEVKSKIDMSPYIWENYFEKIWKNLNI